MKRMSNRVPSALLRSGKPEQTASTNQACVRDRRDRGGGGRSHACLEGCTKAEHWRR